MDPKSFTAAVDHPDAKSDQFKVIALSDDTGIDVSGDILDPTVVYNDEDALQFAVAGKLGLEFPDVAVAVQDAK